MVPSLNTGLVSNFLRHMKTNFSDETLSAVHASVLPHRCQPDYVLHFQKSLLWSHWRKRYIWFPVSCFLYSVSGWNNYASQKSLAMRRCTFPIKFVHDQQQQQDSINNNKKGSNKKIVSTATSVKLDTDIRGRRGRGLGLGPPLTSLSFLTTLNLCFKISFHTSWPY